MEDLVLVLVLILIALVLGLRVRVLVWVRLRGRREVGESCMSTLAIKLVVDRAVVDSVGLCKVRG
ncbi:hypothetical protein DL95DRAFT_381159 [Leptodontidium sp. 2 PMI_412]|nr:hypothetical protein DL95DRAFT_381159 [Leptodontidium sp. 2 PMI_412]